MKTVLIIDHDETDRKTASALLADSYDVLSYQNLAEACAIAPDRRPYVIVLDIASCYVNGLYDPSGAAARIEPRAIVVCSGSRSSTDDYIRSRGISSFVEKPYRADTLYAAVRLASAESVCEKPIRALGDTLGRRMERILLGDCEALREVAKRIALYAVHDMPVLILGESGTGKELAASAIHRASRRAGGQFVPVDCAAIPETLAESTLFGTVKGAFTGAIERKGLFETARGGTVFLDEIGELSLSVQAKFLRTLETASGARIGSVDPIQYDVRILSATNAIVFGDKKRFRPELIHRIDTLVLEMPALRDHKEDIPILAHSFLDEYCPEKKFCPAALQKLADWDWPGNVRELRNVVRRSAVMSGQKNEIAAADIEIDSARKAWQAILF